MTQTTKFADDVFTAVKGYLERGMAGLQARVKALEEREPAAGKDGRDGADGKDAPAVDLEKLAADVLAKVPAPKDGKDAEVSVIRAEVEKAVAALPKPKDGESVPFEVVQALISAEVVKTVAGLNLKSGEKGEEGEPGRDAHEIEVLPGIDPEKRYQRGTWAKHLGGLWVARAATDGMSGWDCVVDGIAMIGATAATSLRSFELSVATSSGKSLVLPFTMPTLLDQGIFKAGEEYEPGDVTTWDGSMWIAQKTTQDKPGTSDAWRLSVKRGRDGRDGIRGEKGERGAEGRSGRDLTQLGFDGSKA